MTLNRIALGGLVLSLSLTPSLSQVPVNKQQELAAHIEKAQQYLREKRPEQAIPELQAAIAIDPADVETQGNLGVLLFFRGQFADAVPHLQAAIDKRSDLSSIQGLLGIAQLRTSNFVDGRKNLEASFPLITEKKFKVQAGLELVAIDTQTGDLEAAGPVISELRKVDPTNAEVLYAAYRTYSDLSNGSMLALSLAAPDSAQMHQLLAHEEVRIGNNAGAITQFRKAVAVDSHLPGIHLELAEALRLSPDPAMRAQAEGEYKLAIAENSKDEKAWTKLGDIAADRGDLNQAAEDYTRASQILPADTDAAIGKARVDLEKNDLTAAAALLENVIAADPSNILAHYRLSAVYRRLSRPDDARRELDAYKKYKSLKEGLREVYKDMRTDIPADSSNDSPKR